MKPKLIWLLLSAGVGLTGCTFPSSHRTVPASQVGVMQSVDTGSVIGVREVTIEGKRTNLGLAGGGLLGAAAMKPAVGNGSQAGALGEAAGAVVGAVAGQATEEGITRQRAQEVTVRLDDGRTVVVTQEVSGGLFQDGDRVRVLNGGGAARVTMATN